MFSTFMPGENKRENILTSVIEPTNAACAPSTEASQIKNAQIAYITTADAAVHSVKRFYKSCLFSAINSDISFSQ